MNPNKPAPPMSDPREETARFLVDNDTVPERRLDVAVEFARSMSQELQVVLCQWQAFERALQQLKVTGYN